MGALGGKTFALLAVVVKVLFRSTVTGFSAYPGRSGIDDEGVISEFGVAGFLYLEGNGSTLFGGNI